MSIRHHRHIGQRALPPARCPIFMCAFDSLDSNPIDRLATLEL
jgi:hypothetical protein